MAPLTIPIHPLALSCAVFSTLALQAESYTNIAYNPSGGSTWNAAAYWSSNPDPVAPGNDYVVNPDPTRVAADNPIGTYFTTQVGGISTAWRYFSYVRDFGTGTPTGGDIYTFNGAKVTLAGMASFRGFGRNTTSVANWEMQDGSMMVLNAGGSGTSTAWNGSIITSGTTALGLITNNATTLTVNASLAGSGTLHLVQSGGAAANLNLAGNISQFTGTLFLSSSTTKNTNTATFSIANSAPSATLQLNWQSPLFRYDLANHDVNFASLILGAGTVLEAGVYTAEDLNELTGSGGIFSGSGTITVTDNPLPTVGFRHRYDGSFADSIGTNHGIANGAAGITTDPAAIASGAGALSLDGADGSWVGLTTAVAFDATSPWSATWWARRGETGGSRGMIMGTAANSNDFIWLNDSFAGLRFRSSTGATFDFTSPKDQQLRHHALVADGAGNLSLYLDGQFFQSLSGNTSFAVDTIGKAYPTTSLHYNFQGSLDEIRLVGSALSATQIQAIYQGEKPTSTVLKLRVVLLAGQSNGDGRAAVSELPTSPVNLQQPQGDVDFYYKIEGAAAVLTTLRPGLTETSQFGPEILLGRRLADLHESEPGTRVAVIKYANGGTNLDIQWKGGGDATTTGDGPEYVTFQQTVAQGLAALAAAHPMATLEVQSMVWVQGEADATSGRANVYQANLTSFIADVRATLGASLPFVISRLSSKQTAINATYLNEIRAAQDAVAAADPRTAILNTDSFGMKSDNLHFNGAGQQSIGSRAAEETAYLAWMIDTFSAADIDAGLAEPDADRDGDGQSNRAEFLGASDPLSSASTFRSELHLTGAGAGEISYATSPARHYKVQRLVAESGVWETALPALQGTGSTVTRILDTTAARGIFRVCSQLP